MVNENLCPLPVSIQETGHINKSPLYTREEACAYLRISIRRLHYWINEGKLIPVKVGLRTYFKKEALDNLINNL